MYDLLINIGIITSHERPFRVVRRLSVRNELILSVNHRYRPKSKIRTASAGPIFKCPCPSFCERFEPLDTLSRIYLSIYLTHHYPNKKARMSTTCPPLRFSSLNKSHSLSAVPSWSFSCYSSFIDLAKTPMPENMACLWYFLRWASAYSASRWNQ